MRILENRVALVIGGSRGIGRAIALELAYAGASVVVVARNRPAIATIVRQIETLGEQVLGLSVDVTDEEKIQTTIAAIIAQWGQIDILVHAVGVYPSRPLLEVTCDEWEFVLRTNLTSAFFCVRAVVPSMLNIGRGLLVLVGSSAVTQSHARSDREAYYASKGGLVGLAAALRASLEDRGIRTLVIHPSWTVDENALTDETKQIRTQDVGKTVVALASLPDCVHVRELVITAQQII